MTGPRSTDITWHPGDVTPEERVRLLGQRGAVVWFTGLSGSGKSTVARAVEKALLQAGRFAAVLDGDNVRHGLNKNLGFSPDDRAENIRRVGEVAKLFAENNVILLAAFVSPYRADRDAVRALLPSGFFLEVYCAASLEVCEFRDPKGLYKKARAGQIANFTGLTAPYEPPEHPESVLNTGTEPLEASVRRVLALLESRGVMAPKVP
jgi:adenylylsulfate kinase